MQVILTRIKMFCCQIRCSQFVRSRNESSDRTQIYTWVIQSFLSLQHDSVRLSKIAFMSTSSYQCLPLPSSTPRSFSDCVDLSNSAPPATSTLMPPIHDLNTALGWPTWHHKWYNTLRCINQSYELVQRTFCV